MRPSFHGTAKEGDPKEGEQDGSAEFVGGESGLKKTADHDRGADEQEDRDPEFFLISHLSYSFFLKSKYSIPQHYALCKKNLCFLEISACILRRNVYNSICC